ncbi:hypothetical protein AABB24_035334 [Solanum stoloniferum]|uniref:Uncharacterized protein n=1 Tax=Solanum stoloniferum TaxID=62892 RepID=A0ABD2R736_9SOLN
MQTPLSQNFISRPKINLFAFFQMLYVASIGPTFSLQQAHQLITGKLGSRIPIITLISQGIFGCNAVNDEFEEVQWQFIENDEAHPDHGNENHGVLLTVGFFPGLKLISNYGIQFYELPTCWW